MPLLQGSAACGILHLSDMGIWSLEELKFEGSVASGALPFFYLFLSSLSVLTPAGHQARGEVRFAPSLALRATHATDWPSSIFRFQDSITP